jgi:adenylyltransferase and sulfurtransferase
VHLSTETALDMFKDYDLILDCTDHPTSRYLISDAAVLCGKPLVSASALRTEGQLLVLNHQGGPCYRCVFPKPPPAASVIGCGEGGILGPVVGVMGVLQALEAMKILTLPHSISPGREDAAAVAPTMLLFSAYQSPPFRTVRLRGRRPGCVSCSANPSVTAESLASGSLDYAAFCGLTAPVNILSPAERISAQGLKSILDAASDVPLDSPEKPLVLDVRDETQFGICSLPDSVNVPIAAIQGMLGERLPNGRGAGVGHDAGGGSVAAVLPPAVSRYHPLATVYAICRFGNDSQLAVKVLKELGFENERERGRRIVDVKGGFKAWREEVDATWPDY